MSRADRRREQRESERKKKTLVLTVEELERYQKQAYERAKEEYRKSNDKSIEEIFTLMLCIPTNVLISDYWEKTAERKIPKFIDDCLELYNSWTTGAVTMTEMRELTEKYGKVQLVGLNTATGKALIERKARGLD